MKPDTQDTVKRVMAIRNQIFDLLEWQKHWVVRERQELNDKVDDLILPEIRKAKLEAYTEFFQEIDREFKSFKIDKEMGKILHSLSSEQGEEEKE